MGVFLRKTKKIQMAATVTKFVKIIEEENPPKSPNRKIWENAGPAFSTTFFKRRMDKAIHKSISKWYPLFSSIYSVIRGGGITKSKRIRNTRLGEKYFLKTKYQAMSE